MLEMGKATVQYQAWYICKFQDDRFEVFFKFYKLKRQSRQPCSQHFKNIVSHGFFISLTATIPVNCKKWETYAEVIHCSYISSFLQVLGRTIDQPGWCHTTYVAWTAVDIRMLWPPREAYEDSWISQMSMCVSHVRWPVSNFHLLPYDLFLGIGF